jgi:membrane protein DedA with SNARE-associated domain
VLDRLVNLVSHLGHWGYLVIFLVISLESAAFLGFLMPGETLAVLGGFLASQGILDLGDLIVLVCVAAILGDSIGYEMGRHLGRAWLLRHGKRFGLDEERLARVDRFFARYGGRTVFLARFSAFFRIMVPFVAGTARLPYARFLFYNALGGTIWGAASVLIGYLAGESWQLIHRWVGRAGAFVIAVVVVLIVVAWLVRRNRR